MQINEEQLGSGYRLMLDSIREKYHEAFSFVRVYGGYPGTHDHKIFVSSPSCPGKLISVGCIVSDNGFRLYDNYLSVKFEEQTRELLCGLFHGLGDEVLILYRADNLARTANGSLSTTFEEFIAEPTSMIGFTAIVSLESLVDKSVSNEIAKAIETAGLCCSGTFYFCTDKPNLAALDPDNFYIRYVGAKTYDAKLSIRMNARGSFAAIEWEDAK